MKERMIQYLLWQSCPNNCEFCFFRYQKLKENKLENLSIFREKIQEEEVKDYDIIAFMGGEIFAYKLNGEEEKVFFEILEKALSFIDLEDYKTNKIFFMTSLLNPRNILLQKTIDFIEERGKLNNIMICTSYDLKGRFDDNKKITFDENFKWLKDKNIKMHIEMILMKELLNNDKFWTEELEDFKKKYTENISFIAPYSDIDLRHKKDTQEKLPYFLPEQKDFISFLNKYYDSKFINIDNFLNVENHSNLSFKIKNGKLLRDDERINNGMLQNIVPGINYTSGKSTMLEDLGSYKAESSK